MTDRFKNHGDRTHYMVAAFVTKEKTQLELAEELGLSPQRVHQIVHKMLKHLACTKHEPEKVLARLKDFTYRPVNINSPEYFAMVELPREEENDRRRDLFRTYADEVQWIRPLIEGEPA